MRTTLEKHGLEAFCEVHTVENLHQGIFEVTKAHGLANLRTNTVIFGWSEKTDGQIRQLKIIRHLAQDSKNILLVRFRDQLPEICKKIDIWWGGQENNGDLMLLLAYLLQLNRQWERAKITVRSVVKTEAERHQLEAGINQLLPLARIRAAVEVSITNKSFTSILPQKSKEADLVFLGLAKPKEGEEAQTAAAINTLSQDLKVTMFVQNNGIEHMMPVLLKL